MQLFRDRIRFSKGNHVLDCVVKGEKELPLVTSGALVLHEDQLHTGPEKIVALLQSKLRANRVVFARKCQVKKTDRSLAEEFLNTYHLMKATQSAYNLGLYEKDELLAIASFSKGRKMNRLEAHQRSYELIRFCCKEGITVTGGLTRLVKSFCEEKSAGDVMTYVDLELSDGASFLKAGFKKHSTTVPNYFLVDRTSFERKPATPDTSYDDKKEYLDHNSGNIKLIFSPGIKT